MTEFLPPPPEVIVVNLAPNEAEYLAQGGANHRFFAKIGNGFQEVNAYQFEYKYRESAMQRGMIEEFTDSLKEAFAQDEIHRDVAQTFADIFDISLKRSYEYTVNVEYTFSVELDAETSPDDVVENLNFEVSDCYGFDFNIDNVDVAVSGHVDYVEV
jgi:hypothetical protein